MELTPEEALLAQLVRVAIRDAQQARNANLREEAARWLWTFAPGIAERARVARGNVYGEKPMA